jgi:predicted secreted protein
MDKNISTGGLVLGGPQPNKLIQKFNNTRTVAWIIFSISAVIQLSLLIWLIIDATKTKDKLQQFELGFVASCPASSSQNAVYWKTSLAAVALIGTGLGLLILSSNPMKLKSL